MVIIVHDIKGAAVV